MLEFHKLPGRPDDWDTRIRRFDTKTLFHESAWLDHVLTIHPQGRIDYFDIKDGAETVGYHCGLVIRKMGIPIHGSPLGGTGTNFMGPLVPADIDQRAVVQGLARLLGPRHYLHMELSHYWLDRVVMEECGFHVYDSVTHVIPIPDSEEAAWNNMKGTARNRARKAEKNGLIIEEVEDLAIVHHFFEQFIEVYGKQGMSTPFGEDRPQSLFDCLMPAGRLMPLWVKYEDEVIAAGLFPYDEKCIYFWGAASWLKHQKLCPNEFLHWNVIKRAVAKGIPLYNMCGGTSQFKDKFGGEDVPYVHYSKSALPLLQVARNWYRQRHFKSLRKS